VLNLSKQLVKKNTRDIKMSFFVCLYLSAVNVVQYMSAGYVMVFYLPCCHVRFADKPRT